MDRISYTKTDKQSIYEIYRACRLCGGGAGYKMPIVQNVIDLDTNGVELKQKIQECLQIEVHQDDKMPPLICELCVDKVNDFYEFMEMCKQINKRTRMRLGLPLQAVKRSTVSNASSDSGDCILGVTEPIHDPEQDDNEPLSKQVKPKKKEIKKEKDEPLSKSAKKKDVGKRNVKEVSVKKEPEIRLKLEKSASAAPARRPPARPAADSVKTCSPKNTTKTTKSLNRELKELLETTVQYKEDQSYRTKRVREKEPVTEKRVEKPEVPAKKVRISLPHKLPARSRARPRRPPPPPAPAPPPPPPPPPAPHPCAVCGLQNKTAQGLGNHIKTHAVTFTSEKLACDPCGEWFSTAEESSVHHKKHKSKPYRCRFCYSVFKLLSEYEGHFVEEDCKPHAEVPDKKCVECWRTYPTQLLLDQHRCQGADGRPGGKCMKCNRMYTLLKNLKKHEATCTFRKKGEAIIDPEVEKRLRDTKIRLTPCDELLTRIKGESYDVSDVDSDYGFDSRYVYPYRYRVKSEPTTGYDTMVAIGDEVKEYYSRNYVHWDSDNTDTDVDERKSKIDTLTAISLKTIFSNKFLGKVPRRRRKVKHEKVFDNSDFDMSKDIDSIIDHLGQDIKNKNDSANDSDCSESIFGPFKNNDTISENAFDSLLDNDSQDTEKNFDLFNTSDNNGCNDSAKINDSDSINDDRNESRAGDDLSNDDSGVKNDENLRESPDVESTDNDKTCTVNDVNDESITQTELSDLGNNKVNSDFTKAETHIDDTSHCNVKENMQDRVGNLDLDSNERISLSDKDVENTCVKLDNNERVDDTPQNNDLGSKKLQDSIEISDEMNGQTDVNNLTNEGSDYEMDDKKLMDALDAEIGENNHIDNHVKDNQQNYIDGSMKVDDTNDGSKKDFIENNGTIGW